MKYIEFLGLPGSGKTTLTEATAAILRANRKPVLTSPMVRVASVRKRFGEKSGWLWRLFRLFMYISGSQTLDVLWGQYQYPTTIHFIKEHPQLARQVIECAEQTISPYNVSPSVFSGEKLLKWFFDVANVYQTACDLLARDEILLLEEGFCQHAYYLFAFREQGFDREGLEKYLPLIPKPDMIISLTTPPEQCEARMNSRSKGVSSKLLRVLSVSERIALLEERLTIYRQIAEYFAARNVQIVQLDNSDYHVTQKTLEDALSHV